MGVSFVISCLIADGEFHKAHVFFSRNCSIRDRGGDWCGKCEGEICMVGRLGGPQVGREMGSYTLLDDFQNGIMSTVVPSQV